MHVLHIVAIVAIGVMTVLAIAATASPWTRAEIEYSYGTIKSLVFLWGYKTYANGDLGADEKWSNVLDNDEPACSGADGLTNRDLLTRYRIAQAGAILSILGSIAFGVLGLVYGLGKLSKKLLLLIPAGLTFAFAMMAYGGYTAAYNACTSNVCESLVNNAIARGATSAKCGPYAGVFLVWAACALGLAAFCMIMARNAGPAGAPLATAAVNATPYQAFPTQHQAYPGQQQPQQYPPQGQAYPGQQDHLYTQPKQV